MLVLLVGSVIDSVQSACMSHHIRCFIVRRRPICSLTHCYHFIPSYPYTPFPSTLLLSSILTAGRTDDLAKLAAAKPAVLDSISDTQVEHKQSGDIKKTIFNQNGRKYPNSDDEPFFFLFLALPGWLSGRFFPFSLLIQKT